MPGRLGLLLLGLRRDRDPRPAWFSVTARMTPGQGPIAGIDEDAWTPIKYPHAVLEERTEQRWISDAEVAEVRFTAFTADASPSTCPAASSCAASDASNRSPRRHRAG